MSKYLTKIVAASLLGDGCVHTPPEYKNCVYSTSKTIDHQDYIDWLSNRLGTLTEIKTGVVHMNKYVANAKDQIHLRTRAHPFYTKFRERMYGTGKKCVDPHYLTLLDWEFMAVWFQEDGTLNTRYRKNCYEMQASIATMCFSYGDHLLLARAIQEKLNIPAHIRPITNKVGERQYLLTFKRKFIPTLLDGIAPFMVPSFQYKCSYDRLLAKIQDEEIVQSSEESEVSAEMTELSNNNDIQLLGT